MKSHPIHKKVGGLHFFRFGRFRVSFCVARPNPKNPKNTTCHDSIMTACIMTACIITAVTLTGAGAIIANAFHAGAGAAPTIQTIIQTLSL